MSQVLFLLLLKKMQSPDHVLSQVLSIYGLQHRGRHGYFVISPAILLCECDEVGYDKAH